MVILCFFSRNSSAVIAGVILHHLVKFQVVSEGLPELVITLNGRSSYSTQNDITIHYIQSDRKGIPDGLNLLKLKPFPFPTYLLKIESYT